MVNYQKSVIYTIRSFQTEDIYIGSTTQMLAKRFHTHKNDYKLYLAGKRHYVTSFKLLEHGDAYIELLEAYPCNSKTELERREGQLIRELECINKNIPGRTKKEYYQDNRDKRLEQMKKYKEANKDKIKERENQKHNCSCGGRYTHRNRSRHMKSPKHRRYIQRVDTMRKEIDAMVERNNHLNRESELLDQKARELGLM